MSGVGFTPRSAERISNAVRWAEAQQGIGLGATGAPRLNESVYTARCTGTASSGGDDDGCDPTYPGTIVVWDEAACEWVDYDDTARLKTRNGESLNEGTLYACNPASVLPNGKLLLLATVSEATDLVHLTGKDYSGSCIEYSGYYVANDGCTYTAGETVCEPIYHERDFDIPVYPPTSPASSRLTTFSSDSAAGSVAWINPANAASSNDSYATATVPSGSSTEYLKALGGCFGIPLASTITTVEVRVEGKASSASGLADAEVKLVKAGTISGTSQHTGADLGASDSVRSYSASPATWGVALTADDVASATFGVALRYAATGAERTVSIDDIEIRISFTPAGATIARQAIYRVYRNAEGQLMFSGLPLVCFARRTGSSDADGDIAYQRIWNQNTGAFADRTLEMRVKLME